MEGRIVDCAVSIAVGLEASGKRRATLRTVPWAVPRQRCQFHLQQKAGRFGSRQDTRKTVAARVSRECPRHYREAERLLKSALETWRRDHLKLARRAETAVPESLTVYRSPPAHGIRLCTTRGTRAYQSGAGPENPRDRSLPRSRILLRAWSPLLSLNSTMSG